MHHSVLELILERSDHHSLKKVLPWFLTHGFFEFQLRCMFHEESGLDLRKRLFMVKLQKSFKLPWPVDKEVQVHSKVINRIDFSIDQVENETLPHITLVNSTGEDYSSRDILGTNVKFKPEIFQDPNEQPASNPSTE